MSVVSSLAAVVVVAAAVSEQTVSFAASGNLLPT
jgi:hypothetical protein